MPRLDDADIEHLDGYLAAHCAAAGGLPDVEALDGFLCAVVAGPELVLPSEWTDAVWGPEHVFADDTIAAEMIERLTRHYKVVVERIRDPASAGEPTDDLLPLVALPEVDPDDPDGVPDMDDTSLLVGALWAHGFALGRDLRRDAWDALVDDWEGLDEALLDIDGLMLGLGDEDGDDDGALPTLGERLDVVQSIPALLHGLYLDAQQQDAPPAAPFRREGPKVGRNDPCPCGSGRKYKLCHGAG